MGRTLVLLALLAATAGTVAADGVCAPPRREMIPGGVETRTRQVHVPACLDDRRVPIYEVSKEPILGCKTVPQYGAVARPVEGFRREPLYEIRRTPICGNVTVPVYAQICKPIMGIDFTSWCEERMVPWTHVRQEVQCGVRQEKRVLGYREEKVQVGSTLQPCRTGWRVDRQFLGYGQEQTVLGTREVRRIIGYRSEKVVVRPARTDTVTETFQRPPRWVTVSNAAVLPAALDGTEGVMNEAQFLSALRAASRPAVAPAPAAALAPARTTPAATR